MRTTRLVAQIHDRQMIVVNTTGLKTAGAGQIVSFGNNRLAANNTNGAFTSTIQQQ